MTIEEQRRAMVLKQSWPVRCRWPRPRGCSVCSERSVWHLKRRFLADDPAGVFHVNRGRASTRRLDERIRATWPAAGDRANDSHLVEAGGGEPGDGPAHPARDPGWPLRGHPRRQQPALRPRPGPGPRLDPVAARPGRPPRGGRVRRRPRQPLGPAPVLARALDAARRRRRPRDAACTAPARRTSALCRVAWCRAWREVSQRGSPVVDFSMSAD